MIELVHTDNQSDFDYVLKSLNWPLPCRGHNDAMSFCENSGLYICNGSKSKSLNNFVTTSVGPTSSGQLTVGNAS